MSEPVASLPYLPVQAHAARPQAAARSSSSFVGHAKLIGLLTLASRVLGMAREIVMAHYLGVGLVASAFSAAFTVPNLFRKLFGEGALSAAFIPLYAQAVKREREGDSGLDQLSTPHPAPSTSSNEFAAASVNLLMAILIGVTVLGELAIGAIVLFAPSLRPDWLLTLKYAAIMLPYVILICGTAFLGGILQVHRRFGPAAAAPIILNVCHVAVVVTGAWALGMNPWRRVPLGLREQTILGYWLGFAVLVAGVLQLLILWPGLRAVGFRFKAVLHFWTPAVRRMLKLTLPVAIGAGVLQISVLLDKGISLLLSQYPVAGGGGQTVTHFQLWGWTVRYPMESGALARLSVAQFLYQFPLGVFAIALATAIFPGLSEGAFDADREGFKATMRQGIEATLFEGLPASLGLILVREPAVRLLFQHGLISAHDAELIARSVLFYSMAIWAFSLQQIVSRAYYALHDTTTPLVMSVVTLSVNLAVEIPLLWTRLGESGMAVGTFASFGVQAVVMLGMLDRRVGGLGLGKLARPVAKMLVATTAMGVALWILKSSPLYPTGSRRSIWLAQLVLMTAAGAGVYFAACEAMGVGIMEHLRPKRRRARGDDVAPAAE
jgi:putative peptidoglycan lipid II flippase